MMRRALAGLVIALTAGTWVVGGLSIWTQGLTRFVRTTQTPDRRFEFAHLAWAIAALFAVGCLVSLLRSGREPDRARRRNRAVLACLGLALAAFMAASPYLVERLGASVICGQALATRDPAGRLAKIRDLSDACRRSAEPSLRRLMQSSDPIERFEAGYGLARLSKGPRDAATADALLTGGDAVYESEEMLRVPVGAVLLHHLFDATRNCWGDDPVKYLWVSTADFRKEWPQARGRYSPTSPLLPDRLASLPSSDNPRYPILIAQLGGPKADEAERELRDSGTDAARAVADALRAPTSRDQRERLARVGRAIWAARTRE